MAEVEGPPEPAITPVIGLITSFSRLLSVFTVKLFPLLYPQQNTKIPQIPFPEIYKNKNNLISL